MYVCLVAMNSIILLWVISVYLKSCDINLHSIFDKNLSTVRGWTFAKFFFEESKKMSSVGVFEKKNLSVFVKENLSVRRKIFKVWRGGKCLSIEFRVFGKKNERKKKKVLGEDVWVEFLLSSCSLVRLYVNLQVKVTEKKNGNFQSILRVGVCALHTLGRHVVKHG